MTIAFNPKAVADAIDDLTISGVTIKTVSNIPQSGQLVTPILFPQPSNFITDIMVETQSLGLGATAAIDFSYTLHYVFLFAELGSGLSQLDPYSPLIQKLELIWETITANDVLGGAVDIKLNGVEGLGEVEDPSGNSYWGALFSLRVLEFAQ